VAASIFNGNAIKILKNILRFKDGTELSSADAANLSGLSSNVQDQLDNKIETSEKGANNGVAELDGSGKVPASQLPSAVMSYLGTWDASTNTPTLADGTGDAGDVYTTSVAGTQDLGSGSISFNVGDWVIYNGTIWEKSGSSSAVVSVNGQSGIVALTTDDVPEGAALYFSDELAQDAVGNILAGSPTIDSNYDDVTPEISFSVAPSSLTDTHISNSANINRSKIASGNINRIVVNDNTGALVDAPPLTGNRALSSDSFGIPVASGVTDTELGYVSGVTSAIQTQINGKEPSFSVLPIAKGGTNSSSALSNNRVIQSSSGALIEAAAITANRALVSDSNGIPAHSSVTNTELGYVSGVTSALQTQLEGKVTGPTVSIVQGDNCNFELSIGAWATYADAAGTQPVDGTGGSPNVTLARTTTTSEVLNGVASLKFSKDAANRQGQGASLDMSVPNYIKGQPCKVSFSAKASANFDFGTPFSSNDPSDITVYLYDVTNAKLLQPFPYTIDSNMGYEGYFQIPSDCASLRLILHVTTTNASAYDLFIDDVVIEEAPNQNVSTDSDWQAYTPTFTNFGTVSVQNFKYRKVGASIEIVGKFTAGTTAGAEARVSLPSGLSSLSTLPSPFACGIVAIDQAAASSYISLCSPSSTYLTFGIQSSTRAGLASVNGNTLAAAGYIISVQAFVPIQGWTSGQVTVASANLNAPVVMRAYKSGGSITASTTVASWTAVDKDSVDGFNASSGVYTVLVPGDYLVSGQVSTTAASNTPIYIQKNGSNYAKGNTSPTDGDCIVTGIVPDCKVGDTLSLYSTVTGTVVTSTTDTHLSITRLVTSNSVYATRVAYVKDVKSSGTAGGTFTSGAYQTRALNTLEGDQSFISLASNQFTLQPGTYRIEASAPGYRVTSHKLKLRNTSDSSDTIIGSVAYAENTDSGAQSVDGMTHSFINGIFSITSAKTFEVQHRCGTTQSTDGFGFPATFGDSEVYTIVKIEKVL
jgi:hypothetical protein